MDIVQDTLNGIHPSTASLLQLDFLTCQDSAAKSEFLWALLS